MDEKAITALLFARKEQALTELKAKYEGLCRRIAGNVLASSEDVEECVSDTFLTVWNRIPPENPTSLTAYISRIARNIAHDRLDYNTAAIRDNRMNICLSELEGCLPGGTDPAQIIESKPIGDTVNRFLATVSREDRILFVRRYFYLDTCAQIGKLTGRSEQSVATRLFRMRNALRQILTKEGITP